MEMSYAVKNARRSVLKKNDAECEERGFRLSLNTEPLKPSSDLV